MMPACVQLAVLLVLQPTPTAAPTAAPTVAAPDSAGKDVRAARAVEHYGQSQFTAAALEFEALHRDFPDEPRFLFNAGATRFAAHHYAHAAAHFNAYIARTDIKDSDRRDAQAQLDETRNRVASVQLSVEVPADAHSVVTLEIRRVARGPADQRPAMTFTASPSAGLAVHVVQLDPGVWAVQLRGDGYTTTDNSFEIRGLAPQQLRLSLLPPSEEYEGTAIDEKKRLRPFAVGLIATSSLVTAAGITVLAAGIAQRRDLASCAEDDKCEANLVEALSFRDAGAGVLGAGVGMLASGLTWLARDARKRRKLWIAGSIVGGVAVVGGATGLVLASRSVNKAHFDGGDWQTHFDGPGRAPGQAIGATALGLGLGLAAGSLASLVVHKRSTAEEHALRIDGSASPYLTGVILSGRF